MTELRIFEELPHVFKQSKILNSVIVFFLCICYTDNDITFLEVFP